MNTSEDIHLFSEANRRQLDALNQINEDIKLVQNDLKVYLVGPFEYKDLSFNGKFIKYGDRNLQECPRMVRMQMYDCQLAEFYRKAVETVGIQMLSIDKNRTFEALNETQNRIARIEKILGIE